MDKSQMSAVYYHGGNAGDDLCYHNELWLTTELWYAYIYCMDNPLPRIWRIVVDEESLSLAGVSVLGDCFDPYDGLDAGSREILDDKGYDGYSFPLEWDGHILDCVVLKDTRKVISIELASEKELLRAKMEYDEL